MQVLRRLWRSKVAFSILALVLSVGISVGIGSLSLMGTSSQPATPAPATPTAPATTAPTDVNRASCAEDFVNSATHSMHALDDRGIPSAKTLTAQQVRDEKKNGPNDAAELAVRDDLLKMARCNPQLLYASYNTAARYLGGVSRLPSEDVLVEGGTLKPGAKYSQRGKDAVTKLAEMWDRMGDKRAEITLTPVATYRVVNTGATDTGVTQSRGVGGDMRAVDIKFYRDDTFLGGYSILIRCANVTTGGTIKGVPVGPTDSSPTIKKVSEKKDEKKPEDKKRDEKDRDEDKPKPKPEDKPKDEEKPDNEHEQPECKKHCSPPPHEESEKCPATSSGDCGSNPHPQDPQDNDTQPTEGYNKGDAEETKKQQDRDNDSPGGESEHKGDGDNKDHDSDKKSENPDKGTSDSEDSNGSGGGDNEGDPLGD